MLDNKTKDAQKTKDVLKQLQAEMRQLQALVSEGLGGRESGQVTEASDGASAGKGKPDALVQYSVTRPSAGPGDAAYKTGTLSVSAAQIGKVTDEAVALLGYALSSPQKVALLRALLGREAESAAALGVVAHLSTGSLYHHLRDLMHAGLIAQAGRNQYHVTPRGQRVLLLLLALAAD